MPNATMIEEQTGWSIKSFVRSALRHRTVGRRILSLRPCSQVRGRQKSSPSPDGSPTPGSEDEIFLTDEGNLLASADITIDNSFRVRDLEIFQSGRVPSRYASGETEKWQIPGDRFCDQHHDAQNDRESSDKRVPKRGWDGGNVTRALYRSAPELQ